MKLNWHKDIFMRNKPRHFQSGAAFTKRLIWNFFFPGLFWPSFKYSPQFVASPSLVFEVPLCLDQSIHTSRPFRPVQLCRDCFGLLYHLSPLSAVLGYICLRLCNSQSTFPCVVTFDSCPIYEGAWAVGLPMKKTEVHAGSGWRGKAWK